MAPTGSSSGPASTSPTVPSGSSAAGPHDDVRGTVQLGMLTVNPHGLDSGEHALNDDVRGTVQSGELTVNPHLSDEEQNTVNMAREQNTVVSLPEHVNSYRYTYIHI